MNCEIAFTPAAMQDDGLTAWLSEDDVFAGQPLAGKENARSGDPERKANEMERVLVVEDLPDNRLVLQDTLEHAGYRVICAANSNEALDILANRRLGVDLVLSDVMMPGLSGYGLCRVLRRNPDYAQVPIILITAKRLSEDDALFGMESGADDYLTRPIHPRLLVEKVKALVARKREAEHWRQRCRKKDWQLETRDWKTHMLVHDLRNPLSGTKMCLELLAEMTNLSDDQHDLVEKGLALIHKKEMMIADILTTAAAQNGRLALDRSVFDLGDSVREQIAEHSDTAAGKHVFVEEVGLDAEWNIDGDHRLLSRVVANLLTNALKYAPPASTVSVRLCRPEECSLPVTGSGRVALVVKNYGPAIPVAAQQRIFEPFTQGPPPGKGSQRDTGVGLGLCFCKEVARLHEGDIGVLSPLPDRENGAAFYCFLP